ncbi:MAG: 30S ribosomal protein S4 [Patescibacteria group bacterium]|nr:30S ribosomal protein S4 [Patescibacteria group bacterium]
MSVCKKCRREGEKLFLKGERCLLPKCAMVKKNYPPGQHGNKGQRRLTEYGTQLLVKQRIKNIYGLSERQLRNYFGKVKSKQGDVGELLLEKLEMRLDNAVFRSGLADSRNQARQMVGHGFFKVNGRKVDIASFNVRTGDEIEIKQGKLKKKLIKDKLKKVEKADSPADWIVWDPAKGMIKVIDRPDTDKLEEKKKVQMVIEYYSR